MAFPAQTLMPLSPWPLSSRNNSQLLRRLAQSTPRPISASQNSRDRTTCWNRGPWWETSTKKRTLRQQFQCHEVMHVVSKLRPMSSVTNLPRSLAISTLYTAVWKISATEIVYQERGREPSKSVPFCNGSVPVLAKEGKCDSSVADQESLADMPALTPIQLIRMRYLNSLNYRMMMLMVALAAPGCHFQTPTLTTCLRMRR